MSETEFVFNKDTSMYFEDNKSYDVEFVCCKLIHSDNICKLSGYLFINDIRDSLGLRRTSYGQTHGWLYSRDQGWLGPQEKSCKFDYNIIPGEDGIRVILYNDWEMYEELDTIQ